MPNAEQNVTVYDRDGNKHLMSYANARDMVKHMGWRVDRAATPEVKIIASTKKPSDVTKEVVVYDPNGVEQKMSYQNARDLVANVAGWSFEPPIVKTDEEPEQPAQDVPGDGAAEKKDEVPAPERVEQEGVEADNHGTFEVEESIFAGSEGAAAAPDFVAEPDLIDFDSLTTRELDAWAKKHLNLEIDGRWSKARMIAAIREKIA